MGLRYLFLLIFLVGCTNVCTEPYAEFGDDCCLDQNNDNICDYGEDFSYQYETYVIAEEYKSLEEISREKRLIKEEEDKYKMYRDLADEEPE